MSDRLAAFLHRFELRSRVFYAGQLCSLVNFDAVPGSGHLHLLRNGALELIAPDGCSTQLSEPSLIFFPRPAAHRLRADVDGGADLICASVHFGTEFGNPLVDALPSMLLIPLATMPRMHRVLELLFEEAFADECGREAALDRLSELLLVHLLRHSLEAGLVKSGAIAGLADPRLAKALLAIHGDPAREWNLETLSEIAGMSRARFSAHFTSIVGTSPGDYLIGWRIGVAQSLLSRGRQIKSIADEVGYGSANALTRAFTQRLGVTPTDWLAARDPAAALSTGDS